MHRAAIGDFHQAGALSVIQRTGEDNLPAQYLELAPFLFTILAILPMLPTVRNRTLTSSRGQDFRFAYMRMVMDVQAPSAASRCS